ncbi:telomeric repeat-binding factor 2-interacting protein 1-like [Pecten maximus]|uniref:telomeric repeat-binding factor 2-interacting protein 1-like n=1 Tax=Pecten maximus TaxID=6579 RepID=UPI001457E5FA|nr:telomeric repeat-binding factor 2-interacting protein 1-like [Pecten maximus]
MAAEKKKPHSRFLFTDDNGEPIVFYMRPCAQKITLKPLIEDGGGGMTVKVTRKCIKLTVESDQISSDDYISTKYILDCVESNKLLAMDKYRLKPKRCSTDHNYAVNEVDPVDDLSPASKIQRTEALPLGRTKYSLADDLAILKHFEKNRELVSMCSGLKIWRDMSLVKVTDHSAESMKDRFKKRILPNIDSYDVSRNIKFLLTKNAKYLADSDHLIEENKEVSKKPATESSRELNQTLSDQRDSFDEYLLGSIVISRKKRSNSQKSLQVVLRDLSLESDKGKSSPVKQAVPNSPSLKENKAMKEKQLKPNLKPHCDKSNDNEKSENISKEGLRNSSQASKSPKVKCPRRPEEADRHNGIDFKKRKLTVVEHSTDSDSKQNKEGDRSSTRLKKKPKTGMNQPNMIETQRDNSSTKTTSAKTNLPLTRNNVANCNGRNRTSDRKGNTANQNERAGRLDYVMEKFLESQNDEVASQEHIVNDSEKEDSEQEEVEEWEIDETVELVQELMERYSLTAKQVLHAFYINNGSTEDAICWIETGLDTAGLPPWDYRDDDRLMSGNWNELETLKGKYGIKVVNNRMLFLEGV